MPGLLDELRREHRSIADILGCLDRQVRRIETGEPPDFDVVLSALEYFESFPDQYHHPKEDLIFARLSERDQEAARSIGSLPHAHEQLGHNLRTFAAAVRSVLQEAELLRVDFVGWARDFIDLQQRHLAMEEASFFPAAERALTEDDWNELKASVPRSADPLHGAAAEAKYETLRRVIVTWDAQDRLLEESKARS